MIVYECVKVINMHIVNELKWRTALFKMHTEESICFFFAIKKRETWADDCTFSLSWSESTNLHSLKNLAVWRVQCMQDKLNWIKDIKCEAELSDMMTWWHWAL